MSSACSSGVRLACACAAYVLDETAATTPQLLRAWWFSDDDVKNLEKDLRRYVRSGMA
jgi:hypothetical protein